MPAPKIARTSVALRTTTGTQDITISGFGTPKAAIIICSGAVTNGTIRAQAQMGVGWTDGTTQSASGMSSNDANTTAGNGRVNKSNKIIDIPNTFGAGLYVEANFVSWVTDGLQINVTTSNATAYLLDVILIGGDAVLNVAAGQVALGTGTAAINTAVGFTPSLVLFHGSGVGADTITTSGKLGFGAWDAVNATQACAAFSESYGTATSEASGGVSNTYGYQEVTSAGLGYGLTVGTYASGFSVTPSASAASDVVSYLAFEFDTGTGISVSAETLPTTTGEYSKTGLAFQPGFLLTASAGVGAAIGTVDLTDAESFTLTSVVRANGADTLCSTSYGVDDSADTMDTSSDQVLTSEVEYSGTASGTRRCTSTFTSFNNDGWTKNLTATDAVAYKSFSLAIQANAPISPVMSHRRMQGMS